MPALSLLALVALVVVSCHIDKLLTGGKTPPSDAPPARVAFSSSLGSARAGDPITPPVQVNVQDSAGRVTMRDTLITLSLAANPRGAKLRGDTVAHSVAGVATFPNLRIDEAGVGYTLRAAFGTATPVATSTTFDITPGPPPPSGNLRVTASTSGDNLDTDGYTVTVDGTTSQSIGNNSSTGVTFSGLSVASHTVELTGVATNCTVTAPNPRTVAVSDGATAVTAFVVTCSALAGSLVVTTSTTGESQDPDGYAFAVDGGTPQSIDVSQTITLTGVAAGSHTVVLSGVAGNCTVANGTSRPVTVP